MSWLLLCVYLSVGLADISQNTGEILIKLSEGNHQVDVYLYLLTSASNTFGFNPVLDGRCTKNGCNSAIFKDIEITLGVVEAESDP